MSNLHFPAVMSPPETVLQRLNGLRRRPHEPDPADAAVREHLDPDVRHEPCLLLHVVLAEEVLGVGRQLDGGQNGLPDVVFVHVLLLDVSRQLGALYGHTVGEVALQQGV